MDSMINAKGDDEMGEKDNSRVFPALTKALSNYLFDEEGNITRNRVVSVGAMAIVLGMLCSIDVFARHGSHVSHGSHSSHVSGSYVRSHSNHYSHSSHASHSSSTTTSGTSVAATSVPRTTSAPAAVSTAGFTASDAVNYAYKSYLDRGYTNSDAMTHVNKILPQLQASPAKVDSIIAADISSSASGTAVVASASSATAGFTAADAVNYAYRKYIESGFGHNDAMTHVNKILSQLQATPSNVESIVTADLSGVSSTGSTVMATASAISAADAVNLVYKLYLQAGLDSATAMARVQAVLSQIQANPAGYLAIVQNDLAAMGITLPMP